MINILLIFITVIISIIFFHIINKSLIEKFSGFDAAHPNDTGTAWTVSSSDYNFSNYCRPGDLCNTQDGWGVYNNNCECIIPGLQNQLESQDYSDELEQQEEEEMSSTSCCNSNNLQGCIRNNTNFDAYCKNIDPSYGVKNISICDSSHSKVECGANYLNGIYYGDVEVMTPCLNKSDDFDTWCKFYNNKAVPNGFNVNSIGTSKILVGAEGGCFVNNGKPDNKKARALCNYNNIDSVKKLERTNNLIDYNTFTSCLPVKNTNFVSECGRLLDEKTYQIKQNTTSNSSTINTVKNISSDDCKLLCDSNNNCYGFQYNKNNGKCLLKNSSIIRASTQTNPNFDLYINDKNKNSRAVEIMGYDCNPGFTRAKCVKNNDLLFVNNNYLYKSIYDTTNNYSTCSDTCS
jgi:hypothetical protein